MNQFKCKHCHTPFKKSQFTLGEWNESYLFCKNCGGKNEVSDSKKWLLIGSVVPVIMVVPVSTFISKEIGLLATLAAVIVFAISYQLLFWHYFKRKVVIKKPPGTHQHQEPMTELVDTSANLNERPSVH